MSIKTDSHIRMLLAEKYGKIVEKGPEFYPYSNEMRFDYTLKPTVIQPFDIIPTGSYLPSDLGFDMPEVEYINVGLCGHENPIIFGNDMKREFEEARPHGLAQVLAHAFRSVICAKVNFDVVDDAGLPTPTMVHEYGHILAERVGSLQHDQRWYDTVLNLGMIPTTHSLYSFMVSLLDEEYQIYKNWGMVV